MNDKVVKAKITMIQEKIEKLNRCIRNLRMMLLLSLTATLIFLFFMLVNNIIVVFTYSDLRLPLRFSLYLDILVICCLVFCSVIKSMLTQNIEYKESEEDITKALTDCIKSENEKNNDTIN